MIPIIRRMTQAVLPALVEMVYPKVCAGCGMRGMWLCDMCEHTVPAATLAISCTRCGAPIVSGPCKCARLSPLVFRARSSFVYDGWVAEAVKRLKYQGEWSRSEHMAGLMGPFLADFGGVDALVPVPLHPARERVRGYNQSRHLAMHIGQQQGVPVRDVLQRTRNTTSQVSLPGYKRAENVEDAFALDPGWVPHPGGHYVLIDDVRTTGATLGACALALQDAHPASVSILTFALDLSESELVDLRKYLGGVASP